MSRRAKPPRLSLDRKRGTWTIRDGPRAIRTGCAASQTGEAEAFLRDYLGAKHKPQASGSPLIADVLTLYHDERLAHTKSMDSNLAVWKDAARWWGDKSVSNITVENCRTYVASKGSSVQMARRGLETLRAALNYWHRSSYGPLDRVPPIRMPPKSQPRRRWLNEDEFGRLLAAARMEHLRRFLLLGWLTGSRPGVILSLEWDWIDLDAAILHRRAPGQPRTRKRRHPPSVSVRSYWRTYGLGMTLTGRPGSMWFTGTARGFATSRTPGAPRSLRPASTAPLSDIRCAIPGQRT